MPNSSLTLDPYGELGVPRDASNHAIKQAYRRIALDTHPDRHADDPASAERFRRASQSYALLRDPERRLAFDKTGRWDDARWDAGELDVQLVEALELFARDFGFVVDSPITDDRAPAHAGRVTMSVDVSYEEVERGGRRRIPAPCARCAGSGAREGSTHVRCTSCGGSGRLRHVESSFLGPRIRTEECESCHGSGRRPVIVCPGCNGSGRSQGAETLDVVIPRGTADGDSLVTITGNGSRFVARLVEDQRWARDGADLYASSRIPYEVAVLGGPVDIELPGRTHRVEVAAGTPSGQRVRIPDHGLPFRDGSGRGSLILTLHVAVPERVGTVEGWLLKARRGRSVAITRPGIAAGLTRLQARTQEIASGQWRQWRAHHHKSSLLRIDKAAAAVGSVTGLLSESEQRRLPMIAPEAARARGRFGGGRSRHAALAEFVVDGLLVTALAAWLWLVAWYAAAAPAVAAAGEEPLWAVMRKIHPAAFGLLPLIAGLGTGALRAMTSQQWIYRIARLPLGIAVGAAAAVTGAATYATAMSVAPEADFVLLVAISVIAAFAVGVAPIFLFLLSDALVDSARKAVEESSDRADRGTTAVRAALALAGSIAVTAIWIAATVLAVSIAFTLFPEAATWTRLAIAASAAALCTLGCFLPAAQRTLGVITGLAAVVAVLALGGIVTPDPGPATEWLAAGAATAALVLSFRLSESIRATTIALIMVAAGASALILWPAAFACASLRRGDAVRT